MCRSETGPPREDRNLMEMIKKFALFNNLSLPSKANFEEAQLGRFFNSTIYVRRVGRH